MSRLARWQAGERRTLWDELPSLVRKPASTTQAADTEKQVAQRQAKAIALTMQGMPSRALARLAGPALATDSPEIEQIMRSKFVQPPSHQVLREASQAPPTNVLTEETIARTILSFHKGLAGGPSGLRPDLLKQVIGKKGDKPGIAPITVFCNLLADGQAPMGVQPYLGGANGFAFEKESKASQAESVEAAGSATLAGGRKDARPVCSGEVWRRVVGKALL